MQEHSKTTTKAKETEALAPYKHPALDKVLAFHPSGLTQLCAYGKTHQKVLQDFGDYRITSDTLMCIK